MNTSELQQLDEITERRCPFNCDAESNCTCTAHLMRRELAAALLTRRDQPEIPMLKNAEGRDAPRRCYLDLMTPAELAIRAACLAVEEMPADVRLTDAVVLLGQAKDAVADFVDGIQATRRDAPQEPPVDTYTPILWVSMSDDQKYAEYLRLRKLVGRDAPPAVNEDEDDHTRVDNGIGSRTTGSTATTNEVIRD